MDYLSYLITHVVHTKRWNPISVNKNGPPISHLMFANDILLFNQVDTMIVQNLNHILIYVSRISGQKINNEKSKLYFSPNTSKRLKHKVISILGIPKTHGLRLYLGFPLNSSKLPRQVSILF